MPMAAATAPRPAYRFTAEVSCYVAEGAGGQGIGRALYNVLIPHLKARGFHALMAVITHPNRGSEALHAAFGFTQVGLTPQVGRKFDCWHDIALWQKTFD